MSYFEDFKWHGREEDETYDEYRDRVEIENKNIELYLKRGRPLKDGEKGVQRRQYIQKRKRRNR